MKLFGYSSTEVLVTATKLGGELMDLQVGLIKAGWLADLILVQSNPVENLAGLQQLQQLLMLMKHGQENFMQTH